MVRAGTYALVQKCKSVEEGFPIKSYLGKGYRGWSWCRFPQYFEWVEESLLSAVEFTWG